MLQQNDAALFVCAWSELFRGCQIIGNSIQYHFMLFKFQACYESQNSIIRHTIHSATPNRMHLAMKNLSGMHIFVSLPLAVVN